MSQRLGASSPERPESSAPVLTPPQTQPLTSYPHNLGNPENEHEAFAPSAEAEFSTLRTSSDGCETSSICGKRMSQPENDSHGLQMQCPSAVRNVRSCGFTDL
ncbi:hypothetical protein Tco_1565495, partial [Tanacetum coccineum]